MKLTGREARAVVYGDSPDWQQVQGTEHPVDHSRWSVVYEAIFLHKPSGKHYEFCWQRGATETQDESPYEYEEEVEPIEVVEKEVVTKQWVPA